MKTGSFAVLLFVLAGAFIALPGCRKENLPKESNFAKQELDPQIKDLEETFKSIGTWQAFLDEANRRPFFGSFLHRKINDVKDPAIRMKYFKRLYDLAFSVPLDATDPAPRHYQLKSLWRLTNDAKGCASVADDVENQWGIILRRLKIFKEEMHKVEAFFEGRGGLETFKGNRDSWQEYRTYIGDLYKYDDRLVSKYFRDTRTAEGLTYERWHYFHSQFEEILGHKVEVWRSVLEKWEKERQKREAAAKAKEVK